MPFHSELNNMIMVYPKDPYLGLLNIKWYPEHTNRCDIENIIDIWKIHIILKYNIIGYDIELNNEKYS